MSRSGNNLRGVWAKGMHVNQSAPFARGITATVKGDNTGVTLYNSYPGMRALHYAQAGNRLFWDEYRFRLERRIRLSGMRPKVSDTVEAGQSVHFDGSTLSTSTHAYSHPAPLDVGMEEAVTMFRETFLRCTDQMHTDDGKPKVTMLLSGGCDSIAVLWALMEIGADVQCVTVGRDENDFDPMWAKRICDYFGVNWYLLRLPETNDGLQALLNQTLGTIEQTSFSNVLMGMCCELAREWMIEHGRPMAWLGYEADAILGNKILQVGRHRQGEGTSAEWGRQRKDSVMSLAPYTLQNAKSFRKNGGTDWRTPFVHPEVANLLYSFPLDVIPADLTKPILYEALAPEVPAEFRAWEVKQKIGFYTGAGIGKVRLENPILQDKNIRLTFNTMRSRLS